MGVVKCPQAAGLPGAAATASGEALADAGWFQPPEQQDHHSGLPAPSPQLLTAIDPLVASAAGLTAPLGEGLASLTWFADECLPWVLPLLEQGEEDQCSATYDDGDAAMAVKSSNSAAAAATFVSTVLSWHGMQVRAQGVD